MPKTTGPRLKLPLPALSDLRLYIRWRLKGGGHSRLRVRGFLGFRKLRIAEFERIGDEVTVWPAPLHQGEDSRAAGREPDTLFESYSKTARVAGYAGLAALVVGLMKKKR